jgi:hypothetical protein
MQALDRTAWEVLNATADDCENLEQIYRMVCLEFSAEGYERQAFFYRPARGAPPLDEVADRVRGLVEAGLLTAVMDENGCPPRNLTDLSYVWRAWFRMTPQGRNAWETSEYANLADQESTR